VSKVARIGQLRARGRAEQESRFHAMEVRGGYPKESRPRVLSRNHLREQVRMPGRRCWWRRIFLEMAAYPK
jgi:hypothetical protein